jgi:spermidine synthase
MPADSTCIYYWMLIDGDAGTALLSHNKPGDLGMLRYDVTNIWYYLKENSESACIIGMGGGKDVLSALEFGINNVTGIDVNPIFIDLQKNRFRNESKIADLPNVKLITDEARSYLSRSDEKFSLIQMALTDTWASTGAGAFTLTENSLYTLEAWKIILSHLDDSGIFTVSRWYSGNNLGETGRIVSLAAASLLQMGIKEPARHIAMLSMSRLATIIVSKNPFNEKDIAVLKSLSQNLRYETLIIPGETPKNDVLRELISVKSEEELSSVIKDKPLNYSPPTDNDPYFFNMLRLSHLGEASTSEPGVLYGNLTASITLITLIIALVIISVLTIFFPVIYAGKKNKLSFGNKKEFWKGAAYFSLIGAGFMIVEIGFIQRLSVFLGHPVYALGILLFTIILSAGTGSFFSENLRIDSAKWKFILPVLAAVIIIIIKFLLDLIIPEMVSSSELVKILAAVAAIFPLGFILGFFFPLGMRSIKPAHKAQTPWYWALNGTFGVLFSALAVFFSIYSGISTNFYLSSFFYLSVVFFIKNPEKKI